MNKKLLGVNNMNKKILVMGLLAVFMLVSISFVSSAEVNTADEKKESPLFGIRTRRAITEKIGKIVENIKTKFFGERVFFLPFQKLLIKDYVSDDFDTQQQYCTFEKRIGCMANYITIELECHYTENIPCITEDILCPK